MYLESDIVSVERFRGVVNVGFRSAMVASSEAALAVTYNEGRRLFFLPFRDVHFAHLKRHGSEAEEAGPMSFWDVVAAGERLPAAVVVFEGAPAGHKELMAHAAFLSGELEIDVMTAEEKSGRVAPWPS